MPYTAIAAVKYILKEKKNLAGHSMLPLAQSLQTKEVSCDISIQVYNAGGFDLHNQFGP